MIDTWVRALPVLLAFALVAWAVATAKRNVGLVDIAWPLFFLLAAGVFVHGAGGSPRAWLVLALVGVWSLRLAAHLAARNWKRIAAIARSAHPTSRGSGGRASTWCSRCRHCSPG